jgi:hypothetical protein
MSNWFGYPITCAIFSVSSAKRRGERARRFARDGRHTERQHRAHARTARAGSHRDRPSSRAPVVASASRPRSLGRSAKTHLISRERDLPTDATLAMDGAAHGGDHIQVLVRVRPPNARELSQGYVKALRANPGGASLDILHPAKVRCVLYTGPHTTALAG